jgi:hypothetical protein
MLLVNVEECFTNLNLFKMTYKLTYANTETWYFPSRALCNWKIKTLKASGNYSREFKIEMV